MKNSSAVHLDERFVPAQSRAVYTVELDGEAVLLDEAANRLHHLNASATVVWACLDGTSTVDEIVADLSAELGHPRDEVLSDTLTVLRHLADEGLLAGFEARSPARWRRRPDALWRRSLDGVVVLPDGEAPVALEGTGPALWDLLAEAHDIDALAQELAGEHRADAAVVAADIEPVLEQLEAAGALERVPN
jgi:hypothetical protein